MDVLSVQVQPAMLPSFAEHDIELLRAVSVRSGVVQSIEVQEGHDSGRYINVSFVTPSPKVLWPAVRERLVRLGLQSGSIVICTGSQGWSNYLLLHHFDREQPTDAFDAL